MPFNTPLFFALFVPLVVACYWSLVRAGGRQPAIWMLVGASLLFYACWKAQFLLLLGASMAFNRCAGLAIAKGRSRGLLAAAVAVNLLVLAAFKYLDFFAESLAALGVSLGPFGIVLPIGISFFTFEQITYLVDIRAGRARPGPLASYCLFITFFPHLVAGPILKFARLDEQLRQPVDLASAPRDVAVGTSIFILGLAKKVLLADGFADLAAPAFGAAAAGQDLGTLAAWAGALAYALQIYFDFSAYSDMAVGLGRMVGIDLPINFNSPYRAASIAEFWRRWHITLSHFLRDYLYIPLGGNRRGRPRQLANLMAVMLLGGLWHGAAWTFVLWGGLHGAALAIHRLWSGWSAPRGLVLPRPLGVALTLLFVVAAWVPFRAPTMAASTAMLSAMVSWRPAANGPGLTEGAAILAGFLVCLVMPNVMQLFRSQLSEREIAIASVEPARLVFRPGPVEWRPRLLTAVLLGLIAFVTVSSLQRSSEFIYFQF